MSILLQGLKKTVSRQTIRSFNSSRYLYDIKPFLLADIGEGITECEILQWFVKPGTVVTEFEKVCEVQSDKASVEISSRYTGNIVKLHYKKNEIAKVGTALFDIDIQDESSQQDTSAIETKPIVPARIIKDSSNWMVPSVRHLLSVYGLKTIDIKGSGKGGRITKDDVLNHIKKNSLSKIENSVIKTQEQKVPSVAAVDKEYTVPLTPAQKVMFKRMTESLSIPHLGYKDEVDLNSTSEYRNLLNKHINQYQEKYQFNRISYMPIFIKTLSVSLTHFPIMNSVQTESSIKYRDYHHIGVEMDTPHGLFVPNIKHVERKTIFEVASEMHRLTLLAQKGALSPSDLEGGTITISNIGSIGGTYTSPIVSPSERAIVSIGKARKLPCFNEKHMESKYILPVSWSADHRIIDGATIAQFSNMWKSLVENPILLSSQLK